MLLGNMILMIGVLGANTAQTPTFEARDAYVRGLNKTGFSLAKSLLKANAQDGNLVLSPYSAVTAHLMLAYGCKGEDRANLLKGLGLSALAKDEAILDAAGLQDELTLVSGNPFTSANAFVTLDDTKPVEAFLKQIRGRFAGEFFALTKQEATDSVNGWVAQKTKQRIPKLLDKFPEDVDFALINAATYDGEWVSPFEPRNRAPGAVPNFTAADGSKIVVDMMFRSAKATARASGREFEAVSLPYKDGAFAMVVALPHQGVAPGAVLEGLSNGGWAKLLPQLKPELLEVLMPAFSARSKFSLIEPLTALGVSRIFSGFNARGMATKAIVGPDQIVLDLQEACIDVDRLGTKAAAATIIGGTFGGGAPAAPPKRFVADRPFVYALYHVQSGAIAFLGVCSKPPTVGGR
jgi:serine protease inhibitor